MTARQPSWNSAVQIALVSLVVAGLACETLSGGGSTRRFEEANQVLLDATSTNKQRRQARSDFSLALREFTESQIEALPPDERAAAFVMRANAQWRLNLLDAARISNRRAQIEPGLVPGSHADVMSQLLPALIVSSQEIQRWNNTNRVVSAPDYKSYGRNFASAMANVAKAEAQLATNTPVETRAFLHYARWRVVTDWRWVVASLRGRAGTPEAKRRAKASRSMLRILGEDYVGLDPSEAINALVLRIPKRGSLRELAAVEAKRPPSEQ